MEHRLGYFARKVYALVSDVSAQGLAQNPQIAAPLPRAFARLDRFVLRLLMAVLFS
jgi:hypothetical protein